MDTGTGTDTGIGAGTGAQSNAGMEALYVHLPFCHHICPFCAFAVHANHQKLHAPYLQALYAEIAMGAKAHSRKSDEIQSVYFGGGTPSAMALEDLHELLNHLRRQFGISPNAEVAFEINPEDCHPEYLAGLHQLGLNRISLGLQSTDEVTLTALGRKNTAQEAYGALEAIIQSPIKNINVDLMLGAPGVSPSSFMDDLSRLIDMGIAHLSFYLLDLEPHTLFGRNPKIATWLESNREIHTETYLAGVKTLQDHGYLQYEVSNFCLPGRQGRQNQVVWSGGAYLGLGAGAHSHSKNMRWHNHRHIRPYQRDIARGKLPVAHEETLSRTQLANEALMLSLRQHCGLNIPQWETKFGMEWTTRRQNIASGLVESGKARLEGEQLILTPRGLLVADAVTEMLME